MKNRFVISVIAIVTITAFTQCSDDKDKDFTIDDLIGSYDCTTTTTKIDSYNGDTIYVTTNSYLVTINKTSSSFTLQSNQLIARGFDGGTSEFLLEITDDVIVILNRDQSFGTIQNNEDIMLNFSWRDISGHRYYYDGVATKR